ncbi:MAG: Abi family protein [Pseudobutyrivibrio sp.]|nr:Abi family protein [Pseudobutyrivibrio sp.]
MLCCDDTTRENGTTFEDIVALYEFDEALRQHTFGYLIKMNWK